MTPPAAAHSACRLRAADVTACFTAIEEQARADYLAASEELRVFLWNPAAPCKACEQAKTQRPRKYAKEPFGVKRNHQKGHGWKVNHQS